MRQKVSCHSKHQNSTFRHHINERKSRKRDTEGYAIASTAKHGIDADKNDAQKEKNIVKMMQVGGDVNL